MLNSDRLRQSTFLDAVDSFPSLGSTNDFAKQELRKSLDQNVPGISPANSQTPLRLIHATQQTAGRGRGGNEWVSSEGALLFSLIVPASWTRLPSGTESVLALLCGLSVAEASARFIPEIDRSMLSVKWPNDVLFDDRKLAGILIESEHVEGRLVHVVGVGVNLNNTFDSPLPGSRQPASLIEPGGGRIDPTAWLIEFCQRFESWLGQYRSSPSEFPTQWSPWCALSGRELQIEQGDRFIRGTCVGIDAGGQLLVKQGMQVNPVNSGSVVEWG